MYVKPMLSCHKVTSNKIEICDPGTFPLGVDILGWSCENVSSGRFCHQKCSESFTLPSTNRVIIHIVIYNHTFMIGNIICNHLIDTVYDNYVISPLQASIYIPLHVNL